MKELTLSTEALTAVATVSAALVAALATWLSARDPYKSMKSALDVEDRLTERHKEFWHQNVTGRELEKYSPLKRFERNFWVASAWGVTYLLGGSALFQAQVDGPLEIVAWALALGGVGMMAIALLVALTVIRRDLSAFRQDRRRRRNRSPGV